MKTASAALIALLANTNTFCMWEGYTITLADGTVLTWTNGEVVGGSCSIFKALSSSGWRYMQVARSDVTNYSSADTSSWSVGSTPFAGKDGGTSPLYPGATLWVTHTRMWLALPIVGTPGRAYQVRIPATIDDTINAYWNGTTLLTQPDGDSLLTEVNVAVPRGMCTGNDMLVLQAVDRTATGHPGPGEYCFVDVEVIGCD